MLKHATRLVLTALAITLFVTTASAGLITGVFDIAGFISVAPTRVISWTQGGTPATANLATIGNQGGFFVGLPSPISIANLVDPPEIVDGVGFPLTAFLSSAGLSAANQLDINFIFQGQYSSAQCGLAAAVGQTCSIANSPFSWLNTPSGGSTASFVFRGATHDGLSNWFGTFTTNFDVPFQTVLTQSLTQTITNSYSGTISVTATPEPGTLATMGLAGFALLGFSRWRRRKS